MNKFFFALICLILCGPAIDACGGKERKHRFFNRRNRNQESYQQDQQESYYQESYYQVPMNQVPMNQVPMNQVPIKQSFKVGDHVNHAANANGLFPAGIGTIESVTPWNTGDGYSYQIRCDMTKKILPVNFKASELSK